MRVPLPVKLMSGYLLVALLIVGPSLWYLRSSMVGALATWESRELRHRSEALRDHLEGVPDEQLEPTARDLAKLLQVRVTLIRLDGTVLFDSDLTAGRIATLENHGDRPEVLEAAAKGYGQSQRMSTTTGRELLYGASILPASGTPKLVVRVARPVSLVREAVAETMRAMRFATGVGLTVALGLSLGAALFVATPLRRLRDAARSFARSEWVPVKRIRTGDELEDLTVAFDELGQKLRTQLVQLGTQESLVRQALESLPVPALLLGGQMEVMELNGALRRHAGITAANEGDRLTRITRAPELVAAREQAERGGLPTELVLHVRGPESEAPAERWLLVPLTRPSSPPLWLLCSDLTVAAEGGKAPEGLHRALGAADRLVDHLWQAHPDARGSVARLRARLDDAAISAGRAEPSGIEPTAIADLIGRATDELRTLHPELATRLVVEFADGSCHVAESSGMAARAIRCFVGAALRALPRGRSLELTAGAQASTIKITLEGSAPPEIETTRELALALGGDAGRVPNREREAAWLELPRA